MEKSTATVRDLIKALQKFPMDMPVFGYDVWEHCDFAVEAVISIEPEPIDASLFGEEEKDWLERHFPYGISPLPCNDGSYINSYWNEHGACPVVVIRSKLLSED